MSRTVWIALAVLALFLLMGSTYVVREGETAMVLKFGRVERTAGPGLHFKIPMVEVARVFDRRLQVLDAEPERYLTSERKDVSVDFFAIGMIEDVGQFYRATGGSEEVAVARLAPIIKDALRNEINARTLTEVVSGNRNELIVAQLAAINRGAETVGVQIVDLRIKRIDLPTDSQVIQDVYRRMRAQRHQVASALRAEGEEAAQTIRAEADRERTVVLAEAERDAAGLRGSGDADATRIYAGAYGDDPGFYAFHRSLQAYRSAFADGQGVIVLEEDDEFLEYFKDAR